MPLMARILVQRTDTVYPDVPRQQRRELSQGLFLATYLLFILLVAGTDQSCVAVPTWDL